MLCWCSKTEGSYCTSQPVPNPQFFSAQDQELTVSDEEDDEEEGTEDHPIFELSEEMKQILQRGILREIESNDFYTFYYFLLFFSLF